MDLQKHIKSKIFYTKNTLFIKFQYTEYPVKMEYYICIL